MKKHIKIIITIIIAIILIAVGIIIYFRIKQTPSSTGYKSVKESGVILPTKDDTNVAYEGFSSTIAYKEDVLNTTSIEVTFTNNYTKTLYIPSMIIYVINKSNLVLDKIEVKDLNYTLPVTGNKTFITKTSHPYKEISQVTINDIKIVEK